MGVHRTFLAVLETDVLSQEQKFGCRESSTTSSFRDPAIDANARKWPQKPTLVQYLAETVSDRPNRRPGAGQGPIRWGQLRELFVKSASAGHTSRPETSIWEMLDARPDTGGGRGWD